MRSRPIAAAGGRARRLPARVERRNSDAELAQSFLPSAHARGFGRGGACRQLAPVYSLCDARCREPAPSPAVSSAPSPAPPPAPSSTPSSTPSPAPSPASSPGPSSLLRILLRLLSRLLLRPSDGWLGSAVTRGQQKGLRSSTGHRWPSQPLLTGSGERLMVEPSVFSALSGER